jgi:AcrR family transcriptional regulator
MKSQPAPQARAYVMTARAAKMEATRKGVIEAAIALYLERGIDGFTLDELARRSATTVQTILRIHKSRDGLLLNMADALGRAGVPMKPTPPGDIEAAVAVIFDLYEGIGDAVMQNLAQQRRSSALRALIDNGRRDHRDWIAIVFAPQLAARQGEARETLRQALIVATDLYTWQILRRDNELAREAAQTVMRAMIEAVTNREMIDG